MSTTRVIGKGNFGAFKSVIIDELLSCINIILAVFPSAKWIVIQSNRNEASCRSTKSFKQGVNNVTTVNCHTNCTTKINVFHNWIVKVKQEIVNTERWTSKNLLIRSYCVTICRLTIFVDILFKTSCRNSTKVHVACFKLTISSVGVFLNRENDGIKISLLGTIVVVITLKNDLLTAFPFTIHLVRTITNRSKQEVIR
ncbi:Uncharacterised protein [Chlamydia trachomatis]|nr:Uncharacterised protein [Chlamydia trachomatis]